MSIREPEFYLQAILSGVASEVIYLGLQDASRAKAVTYISRLDNRFLDVGQDLPAPTNQLFTNSGFAFTSLLAEFLESYDESTDLLGFVNERKAAWESHPSRRLMSAHIAEMTPEAIAVILGATGFLFTLKNAPVHELKKIMGRMKAVNPEIAWQLELVCYLWYSCYFRGPYIPEDGLDVIRNTSLPDDLRNDLTIFTSADIRSLRTFRYDPPLHYIPRFWLFLSCFATAQEAHILTSTWKAQLMKEFPFRMRNFPAMCLLTMTIELSENPGRVLTPTMFGKITQTRELEASILNRYGVA